MQFNNRIQNMPINNLLFTGKFLKFGIMSSNDLNFELQNLKI